MGDSKIIVHSAHMLSMLKSKITKSAGVYSGNSQQ